MKKRILSIVLTVAILLLTIPVSAFAEKGELPAAGQESEWLGFEEFSSAVSELLGETMEDDYISGICLEVGESEMVVDGEVQPVVENREVTPVTKDDILMLPVRALAEREEAKVSFDRRTGTATVQTEEGEIAFTHGEAKAIVSEGEKEGLCALSTEPELIDGTLYVPLDTMADFFGYETEAVEDKVLLTKPYQTKRLIVKSEEEELETYGAVKEISGFRSLHVLQYETEEEARSAHEKLLLTEGVEYVEPDTVVSVAETHNSWGADFIEADTYNEYLQTNTGLEEVVVAVVDTGVYAKHEFLKDRVIPVNECFIENGTSSNDLNGHGTHVSGIIVDCTLPNVKILPVRVLDMNGYGTELSIYNGMLFSIQRNCDVINLSLGGYGKRELEREAMLEAVSHNISVVVAAGNESLDAGLTAPARYSEAVTVGALEKTGLYADYSNYGDAVDLWAPGSEVLSCQKGEGYTEKSGTSMATPHVAAAAAMLKTYQKELSPRQIESILMEHAVEKDIQDPHHSGNSKVLSVASLRSLTADAVQEAVAAPVISEPGGYYQEDLTVSITCDTPGAEIRYTLDGSDPVESGRVYTGPVKLQGSARFRVQAFKPGCIDSYQVEETYFISEYPESLHYKNYNYYDTWTYTYPDENVKCLKVTFDEQTYLPFPAPSEEGLRSGPYFDARLWKYGLYLYDKEKQPVNNEFAEIERTHFIHEELQGKSVIVSGNSFSMRLNFPLTGSDYGFKVKSVEPIYEERLSPPEFVTPCGNIYWPWSSFSKVMIMGPSEIDYAENKSVTLRSAENADIYYTLDGSIPTRNSLKYTGPILLDEPKKIRAKAFKNGYTESAAVSETYYSSKYPESLHNVKREYYFIDAWNWEAPLGVKYIGITFDESTDLGEEGSPYALDLQVFPNVKDFLGYDPTVFYGTELAGQTIYIKGNNFRLVCGAYWPEGTNSAYGYKIKDIQYYYNENDIVPIESIKISGPSTLLVGEEAQLSAEVTPPDANSGLFWRKLSSSSMLKSNCAEIDKNGVITGKQPGQIVVVATSGLVNSVCNPGSPLDWPNYSYNGMYKGIAIKENPDYAGSPTPAVLTKAPKAKTGLKYTGEGQVLIEPGEAAGGTLLYSQSENGEYSQRLPVNTDADTYTVWYKIKGDETHTDLAPASLPVTIAKADRPVLPENISVPNGTELTSIALPVGWFWQEPDKELSVGANTVSVEYWDTKNFAQTRFTITVTMAPLAHLHEMTKTEAKAASCTAEGNLAYWTCSICDGIFLDEQGTTEVSLAEVTLEKLPHTPGAWTVVTPATAAQDGLKQKACTVCHTVLETEVIPKGEQPVPPAPGPVEPDPPAPEKLPFVDVKENSWYYDAVRYVYFNSLMAGTAETLFSPEASTTRGMIVTILWRLEGKPESGVPMTFTDVRPGTYYQEAIAWAAEQGIVAGRSEKIFAPDDPITRQELAAILHRYAGSPEAGSALDRFADSSAASKYAKPALSWAVEAGVLSGKGNGILDPKGRSTRAEAASMLMRYCGIK